MTSPNSRSVSRYGSEDSLSDWFMAHKRQVSWAVLAVAVAVGGIWYFQRSRSLKEQHAERAYFQARQSANAGNIPLAVSDLKKVVTRYEGTRGGTQAAMFLAQSLYDQKNHKDGINELKKALSAAPAVFTPSIHVLIANGHEELKEFAPAAEAYKAAAQASGFPADKAKHQAAAARAYMAAGKPEEAKAIWTELAKDESGPMAAEARVRLGELSAKAMSI